MDTATITQPEPLDKVTESFLKIFCDTLFPGGDFSYKKTRMLGSRMQYEFVWYPLHNEERAIDKSREALWIRIDESFLDFHVLEYNDSFLNFWDWYSELKFRKLPMYRIFEAYEGLRNAGAFLGRTESLMEKQMTTLGGLRRIKK